MGKDPTITLKILSDAKGAMKDVDQLGGRLGKLQSAASKATPAARAVGVGLLAIGTYAASAASDLQQAQGAVESVYGKSAAAVEKYASTSASRLGVAKDSYLQSAALMGSALQNAGFKAAAAATQTDKAFTRSADLAATFGGSAADAMDAINAAVSRGEFDPLEKYAISLNQTAIMAELGKRGQDKLTGAALKNAKAQASLDLIYQQTNKVAGQFAREANTAAGAQQRAQAAFRDASAELGTALLPTIAKVVTQLAKLAVWINENRREVQIAAVVLGTLAAAVLLTNAALRAYTATTAAAAAITRLWNGSILILRVRLLALAAAQKIVAAAQRAWAAAQWLLNAAMTANPIGLVIAGIVALGAALVLAYNKSTTFRNIVNGAFSAVRAVVLAVVGWFGKWVPAVFGAVVTAVRKYVSVYRAVVVGTFNAVRATIRAVMNALRAVVVGGWSAVIGVVTRGAGTIVSAVRAVPGKIRQAGSLFLGAGKALMGKLVEGLKQVGKVGLDIGRNLFNGVIDGINSAIRSVNDYLPDKVGLGKFSINLPNNPIPTIPKLAQGGITTGPTLALIGDNPGGREAVIPLDKYPHLLDGDDRPIVIYQTIELDGQVIDKRVERINNRQARRIATGAA